MKLSKTIYNFIPFNTILFSDVYTFLFAVLSRFTPIKSSLLSIKWFWPLKKQLKNDVEVFGDC